jgi:hypothetical protein
VRSQKDIKICEVQANLDEVQRTRSLRSNTAVGAQRLLAAGMALSIPAALAFMTTSWVLQSSASLPEWIVKTVCMALWVGSMAVTVSRDEPKYLLVGMPGLLALSSVAVPFIGSALIVLLSVVSGLAVGHFVYKGSAPMQVSSPELLSLQSKGDHA